MMLLDAGRLPRAPRARADGLTLVELLVVLALCVVVGGVLIVLLMSGGTSHVSTGVAIQIQQEARKALDAMDRELREAGPSGAIVATATQLDFQIALGFSATANTATWGAKDQQGVNQPGWSLRYEEVAGPGGTTQLVRKILNGGVEQPGTRVLANYVDAGNTSFGWNAASRTVTINLTVRYESPWLPGGFQQVGPLSSQIELRNAS